jgi:hypothetical protein
MGLSATFERRDFRELDGAEGAFDGLVSAFGALNMAGDLTGFAFGASVVVRPGGSLIVHMLSRFSAWHVASMLRRGDARLTETLAGIEHANIAGHPIRHRTYTPDDVYDRYFSRRFDLRHAYALGALRPPHRSRLPSPVLRGLARLERRVRHLAPLRSTGRFFVLELVRR